MWIPHRLNKWESGKNCFVGDVRTQSRGESETSNCVARGGKKEWEEGRWERPNESKRNTTWTSWTTDALLTEKHGHRLHKLILGLWAQVVQVRFSLMATSPRLRRQGNVQTWQLAKTDAEMLIDVVDLYLSCTCRGNPKTRAEHKVRNHINWTMSLLQTPPLVDSYTPACVTSTLTADTVFRLQAELFSWIMQFWSAFIIYFYIYI